MGQLSVLVMIAEEETENLKMFCRGGQNCCGKESNRLCDEGQQRGQGLIQKTKFGLEVVGSFRREE